MPLPQFSPGAASTAFYGFAVVSGRVVVATETSSGELQLYATDGSPAKPTQLTRFSGSQELSIAPGLMRISDRRAAFEVDAGGKKELWSTNGTPKGTRRVAEVTLPFASGPFRNSLASGGWLYFSGYRKTEGTEPWRTDGITAALLRDTCKGACSGSPVAFAESAGEIYFQTSTPAHQPAYWRTRQGGSRIGAVLRPGGLGFPAGHLLSPIGDVLLVSHSTLHQGLEPWAWRATGAFEPLGNLHPMTSPADSNPRDFQPFDDRVVFVASDATLGDGFWVSDRTAEGTKRLEARGSTEFTNIAASAATERGIFLVAGGYLLSPRFPRRPFFGGLWFWDGASPYVERLTPSGTSVLEDVIAAGDRVFFSADGALWMSDGTVAGTQKLSDADRNKIISLAVAVGTDVYFFTLSALWKTDGTPAGTVPVLDLQGMTILRGKGASLGERVFFLARRNTGPNCQNLEVWSWGEANSNEAIVLESQDCLAYLEASLSKLGSNRLLVAAHSVSPTLQRPETRLWITDGTANGTQLVARTGAADPQFVPSHEFLQSLSALSNWRVESQSVASAGNRWFFMGPGDLSSWRLALWSSDGSAAGSRSHANLLPQGYRSADSTPISTLPLPGGSPWAVAGRIVFQVAEDLGSRRYLLETQGTAATTYLHGGTDGAGINVAGGRLFFSRRDDERGAELWVLEDGR
jgi:ELWxxDGT repeat protein